MRGKCCILVGTLHLPAVHFGSATSAIIAPSLVCTRLTWSSYDWHFVLLRII
ncbi:hypothetical protein BX600DRAFT_469059 [Xylariales sp. PMI_506]|nr:hypothetical protein BX600DRAFT_469059 [Xylariales sp. PMI_506]